VAAGRRHTGRDVRRGPSSGFSLAVAVAGFFMITLDAVVVKVALPTIRRDLGGGVTGLQ
jgi:DHA2 family methylenomycin A resistance protein-like MFS transporter